MADIGRVRYTPYPANQSLQSSNAFCLHYYEELVLAQDAIGFFYPADLPEVQISLVLMPANYLYHRETNNHCETPTALIKLRNNWNSVYLCSVHLLSFNSKKRARNSDSWPT